MVGGGADRGDAWDLRYAAAEGGLFGEAPCDALRAACARPGFAPRSALMLADGDGRNGAWLAARGVAVDAVDLSAEATRRARLRDAGLGVAVARTVADLRDWAPPPARRWDMAAVLYLQGPAPVRLRALGLAVGALAPGGWLLVEGFAAVDAAPLGLGPADPAKRYAMAELRAAAAGLEVVEALVGEVLMEEGPRHRGPAHVLRFLARRPA